MSVKTLGARFDLRATTPRAWRAREFGPKHDHGFVTCAPADFAKRNKHQLLSNLEFESANMIIQDGVIIASRCAPASTLLAR